MPSKITIQLDPEVTIRLQGLAVAQNCLPEAILHEALAEYLNRKNPASAVHAGGKHYPARHPVGGIITPV